MKGIACCFENLTLGTGQPKAQILALDGRTLFTSLPKLQQVLGNTTNLQKVPGLRKPDPSDNIKTHGVKLVLDVSVFGMQADQSLRDRVFKAAPTLRPR